ncbi:MAG TPA: hypothetical protein VNK46_14475 [Nitrospiraceae bacterium]|jgi:hypothetical protein|nr:hypothetical protein [Nitrospiraceae bacterium]
MRFSTVAVVLIGVGLSAGCAGTVPPDTSLREARYEREAASARLLKALARYCSLTARSLDAQHQCIVEHRLLPFLPEPGFPSAHSTTSAAPLQFADGTPASLVHCQRVRSQTTCRRADRLSTPSGGG